MRIGTSVDSAPIKYLVEERNVALTRMIGRPERVLDVGCGPGRHLAALRRRGIDAYGIDIAEVTTAANSQPYSHIHTPGTGVGGHCIPLDPHYLAWKLRTLNYNARFVQLADEVNSAMPAYWVGKVQDALNEQARPLRGSEVLVVGVAYKKDSDDVRESPALAIIALLRDKGVDVMALCPGPTDTDGPRRTGVDPDKVPVKMMTAAAVAEEALAKLGKKSVVIPGLSNRVAYLGVRLAPRRFAATIAGKLVKRSTGA